MINEKKQDRHYISAGIFEGDPLLFSSLFYYRQSKYKTDYLNMLQLKGRIQNYQRSKYYKGFPIVFSDSNNFIFDNFYSDFNGNLYRDATIKLSSDNCFANFRFISGIDSYDYNQNNY